MIQIDTIQDTAEKLMAKAAIDIPDDYLQAIRKATAAEENELPRFVLEVMLENYDAATQDRRAMCGDTGIPRWFVKMGNDALAVSVIIGAMSTGVHFEKVISPVATTARGQIIKIGDLN